MGVSRYAKSVVVFQSQDYALAQERALAIGRSKETTYTNGDNKQVKWKLESIETLDILGEKIEDGREVYSEFQEISSENEVPFTTEFHPERSKPTQTGV